MWEVGRAGKYAGVDVSTARKFTKLSQERRDLQRMGTKFFDDARASHAATREATHMMRHLTGVNKTTQGASMLRDPEVKSIIRRTRKYDSTIRGTCR